MSLRSSSSRANLRDMCRRSSMSANIKDWSNEKMHFNRNTPVLRHSNTGVMLPTFLALVITIIAASVVQAEEAKARWQVEWEKIVQAAKKEGQVTVYVHSTYAPALEAGAFQKAFPDIKLVSVSGVELQLERRFMAERRAGKNLADVFMVGVLRSYDF